MSERSYNQFCGLAYALDRVGERWTLLIIRELMAGPRRFKDLLDGLPGISTNLLTERLTDLKKHGLVQRRILPPPAASAVYELTALGEGLKRVLLELGKWGAQFAPASPEGVTPLHLGSYALTPQTFFHPELAQGVHEVYEFHAGDEVIQVKIADGAIQVKQGQPWSTVATFHTDVLSYLGLIRGQLSPEEALVSGAVRVEGDPAALQRFAKFCSGNAAE
ncbi:MAG: transcriptional regulator [Caldilinea sp. CFX5]|nr:transcriptional regulator [Caldilinea sp. CFX5]